MKTNFIEAKDLPEEEKVYLKKDLFGWRVIDPWKNPDTGKINWFVFLTGGKKALAITIFIMLVLGLGYLGYKEQLNNYKKVMENPCPYCVDCQAYTREFMKEFSVAQVPMQTLNLNKINITAVGGEVV